MVEVLRLCIGGIYRPAIDYTGLLRAYSGSIFSYYGGYITNNEHSGTYTMGHHTRAVIVQGEGI